MIQTQTQQGLMTAPAMSSAFPMSSGQPTFQSFNQAARAPVPNYSVPQPMTGNFSQFSSPMSQPATSLFTSSDSGTFLLNCSFFLVDKEQFSVSAY